MVKLYEKNPKKHPDIQLKQIASSLKEFGWRQPIVIDKNETIIVGHGRWLAYQKYPEGIKEPWIVKADDLTPVQVKAYRLADNKLNESDWDMGLAIEELKELDDYHFNLTGFDRDLLIEPNAKDDIIPDSAPKRVKLGEIWALGRHRVMAGDSTKREDVERLMGS
jgi:site-specific DNA-methyltransferase (adenine-specific)